MGWWATTPPVATSRPSTRSISTTRFTTER